VVHVLNITIFSDIFPPDMGGGATRAYNIAKCLVQQGHNIQIVTSLPHYPIGLLQLKALRLKEIKHENWHIICLPTLGLPHKGFFNRLINYCWYAFFSLMALTKIHHSNIVFCSGPHPFADFSAYLFKVIKRAKMIIDISDLWPETIPFESLPGYSLVQGIGCTLNKLILGFFCDGVCIFNERALKFVKSRYDYRKPTAIVPNFVDTHTFIYDQMAKTKKETLTNLVSEDVADKFVVLYHGVIGPYQKIENVVKAAGAAREIDKILFIVIGDGEEKERAMDLAKKGGLDNIIFLPKISRKVIAKAVAESDLGLVPIVSNNPLMIKVSVTTKALEFLSCGTPIIAPKDSFIGRIASTAKAGFEVDFSDPSQIYHTIKHALDHPALFRQMRERARRIVSKNFSYDKLCQVLSSMIIDVDKLDKTSKF